VKADFFLQAERGRIFCRKVLAQLGVGEGEAEVCANSLLDASLRGVDSHGVALLPTYAERIRSGQVRPGRKLQILREGPATALCNGQHGLGPVLACQAMDLAMAKARESGAGVVNLADGNYVGALAFYAARAARAGLWGLCAATSTPRVAPWGGRQGLHGTNPLAYAAPVQGEEPLVFDAATGHSAARLHQAVEEGRELAEGIALDREGRPTRDPKEALEGILLPVGGALGYGLGLLVDLLCGGLSGGPCGQDVPPVTRLEGPYGCGFLAMAIDPEHFAGREVFAGRSAFLAKSGRAVRPACGVERVRMPGDRGREERERRLREGIPFTRRGWHKVLERLAACGVEVEEWRNSP
jgi:LDH2 family malate/lactate/ureidoglycolate dehydrogenase